MRLQATDIRILYAKSYYNSLIKFCRSRTVSSVRLQFIKLPLTKTPIYYVMHRYFRHVSKYLYTSVK